MALWGKIAVRSGVDAALVPGQTVTGVMPGADGFTVTTREGGSAS